MANRKTAASRERKTATKKSAASPAPKTNRAVSSQTGTYTVPRGHVSIGIPAFWTLRQTNDDLEVEAPSGNTSVIVTAFQRTTGARSLDARDYLKHFLETAPRNGRVTIGPGSKAQASARYRDPEGDRWEVIFLTNGKTLLLATCNSNGSSPSREARMGLDVLRSMKLKRE